MITKGILYYTDNQLDEKIAKRCQEQLLTIGLPITSVSLKPMDFGKNIVLPLEPGYLTMARQILAGLESMTESVIFFCEHDVIYSKEAFNFLPPDKNKVYYNTAVWKINMEKGYGLKVDDCRQLSGLCAYRELLVEHYRRRVVKIEKEGFTRAMGFEVGTHNRKERVDDIKSDTWISAVPILDLRTGKNLTADRWDKSQFRNKKYTEGWTEAKIIPGWSSCEKIISQLT